MGFTDFSSESGLATANHFFSTRSYVEGYAPTQADVVTFKAFKNAPDAVKYPHVARWYKHIASYESEFAALKGDPSRSYTSFGPSSADIPVIGKKAAADDDDDDDMDLFGSDDDEDAELIAQREKNLAEYRKRPSKQKIAKSFVTLEIKPASSRTPMTKLRDEIKRFLLKAGPPQNDGLSLDEDKREARPGIVYSADKMKDIGYGIKKLQVLFTVEDEKISVSDIQEDIEKYFGDDEEGVFREPAIVDEEGEVVEEEEGWVQSTDLVEMQKL
ncbi:elongation factor 1-beta [Histoplasma capsulatum G186AR]|uniref:Elongation factor 1-beta n=2 Tax=Ajellomyces capsulatus TaxID=5037 RepID=C0NKB6_AJECG|nr:elongation factor 1-beta [Histoplasma capsulatum G186AR]EEH08307.1 elongation factor 1-beta [Histoplasma capsulatum G186AR]KAG5295129.1 elongation factor 1-beta [Histoplasma ohiense (nom. inval.)]KAG5299380.1 elongation factor 1-beta [Histoplasma capsulatum]QSS67999.1 elongation factor 1-beta [Histoplasma capsulatum G186AR]